MATPSTSSATRSSSQLITDTVVKHSTMYETTSMGPNGMYMEGKAIPVGDERESLDKWKEGGKRANANSSALTSSLLYYSNRYGMASMTTTQQHVLGNGTHGGGHAVAADHAMSARKGGGVAWVPDSLTDSCYQCKSYFSLVLRRHHCRRCGNIFCDACSLGRMPLVSAGFFTPVRVCDKCFRHVTRKCSGSSTKSHHRRSVSDSSEGTQSIGIPSSDAPDMSPKTNYSHSHSSYTAITENDFVRDHSVSSDSYLEGLHTSNRCIQTLSGEHMILTSPYIKCRLGKQNFRAGALYVTNYRLVFVGADIFRHSPLASPIDGKIAKGMNTPVGRSFGSSISSNDWTSAVAEDRDSWGGTPHEADSQHTLQDMYHTETYYAIPLLCVERIKKKELSEDDAGVLELTCKDFRELSIVFEGLVGTQTFTLFDRTFNTLCQLCFQNSTGSLLAPFAKTSLENFADVEDGWSLYDSVAELNRLGVGRSSKWRITSVNATYEMCPSFPAHIAVPSVVSDKVLLTAAEFRTKRRIPTLSWLDRKTGASICRSSQPLVGLGQNQCAEDIYLIQAISNANPSSTRLVIVDARPWKNAVAQKAMGRAGYELTSHYETRQPSTWAATERMMHEVAAQNSLNMDPTLFPLHEHAPFILSECDLVFMGIENIHVMKKSFAKLQEACATTTNEKWLEHSASSKWLEHLSVIMESAVEITKLVKSEKTSCLVHCSDGWDRTAQLTGLAMILLDPYYRTIHGFEILIEKEWCSFGHKFQERLGHGVAPSSAAVSEVSPVFLQWIDCVWQVHRQFPCSFEFNERFLVAILDHAYSCRFGTFLYNNEKERKEEETKRATVSLWTYINNLEKSFVTNPFYDPTMYSREAVRSRVLERRHCQEVLHHHQHQHGWSVQRVKQEVHEEDDIVLLHHTKMQSTPSLDVTNSVSVESVVTSQKKRDACASTKGIFDLEEIDAPAFPSFMSTGELNTLPNTNPLPLEPCFVDTSEGKSQKDSIDQSDRLFTAMNLEQDVHSIVKDLDSGLVFPHVVRIENKKAKSFKPGQRFIPCDRSIEPSGRPLSPRNEHIHDDNASVLSDFSDAQDEMLSDENEMSSADYLVPNFGVKSLRFWSGYYFRWDPSCAVERNANLEMEVKIRDLVIERDQLMHQIELLKKQNI